MKLRNTLALLIFALVLGGFVFGLDRCSQSSRERSERSAHIARANPKDIQGFTIQNGDETIRVQADGDDWKMLDPWKDDADISVVDQLLDALQGLQSDDTIADLGKGEKKRSLLKDFGLNKPKLRLRLEGKGMPAEFQFGQDAAVRGRSYLKIRDDDAVFVVNNDLKDIVSRKAEDFRDHRMTPFLTPLIERAIFRVNGGEIELSKEQDNWVLFRPIKARASNDAVASLLTKINQAQIVEFISGQTKGTAAFGVDASSRAVTLFAGQNKADILIGNPVPSQPELVYAQLPDRNCLVAVGKEFASLFDLTPNDLRDRKIARLNADLIDRVTIERPGQKDITLGREESRWYFLSPTRGLANAQSVATLIQTLDEGEIANFVSDTATDLPKYGLDHPEIRMTFSSYSSENTAEANAGETVLATVVFGSSAGGMTYARLEQEPYIFSVPDKFVHDLASSEIRFRTLDILELRRDELEGVRIEKPGQDAIELVRGPKDKWVIKGRDGRQDDAKVQSFLDTLASLRASAWVGNDYPVQNLDSPSVTVKIRYLSGEKDRDAELKLGGTSPEGRHFGISSEQTGVFLLDNEQFDRLNASLTR
jgi:hypothetical protein